MAHLGWAPLVILAGLFAGCLSTPGPDDNSTSQTESANADAGVPGPWSLDVPTLEIGQSWTYRLEGFWDAADELTIVVARADSSGYLLAAAAPEELVNEVAWDNLYLGEFTRTLEPLRTTGEPAASKFFVFPITDNATWTFDELNVTARRTNVDVLGEALPGVRIEGANEAHAVLFEYAPDARFITRYEERYDGELAWSLSLTGMRTMTDWVWYERANEVFVNGLADQPTGWDPTSEPVPLTPPAELVVQDDDDEVIVWWIGAEGSTGMVLPPPGGPGPQTFEGAGEPNFRIARFEALPGSWHLTGVPGNTEGWSYLQGHAIRWITGP